MQVVLSLFGGLALIVGFRWFLWRFAGNGRPSVRQGEADWRRLNEELLRREAERGSGADPEPDTDPEPRS